MFTVKLEHQSYRVLFHWRKHRHKGRTMRDEVVCKIVPQKSGFVVMGRAKYNRLLEQKPLDKEVGRRKALARALKLLGVSRAERLVFWETYHAELSPAKRSPIQASEQLRLPGF